MRKTILLDKRSDGNVALLLGIFVLVLAAIPLGFVVFVGLMVDPLSGFSLIYITLFLSSLILSVWLMFVRRQAFILKNNALVLQKAFSKKVIPISKISNLVVGRMMDLRSEKLDVKIYNKLRSSSATTVINVFDPVNIPVRHHMLKKLDTDIGISIQTKNKTYHWFIHNLANFANVAEKVNLKYKVLAPGKIKK